MIRLETCSNSSYGRWAQRTAMKSMVSKGAQGDDPFVAAGVADHADGLAQWEHRKGSIDGDAGQPLLMAGSIHGAVRPIHRGTHSWVLRSQTAKPQQPCFLVVAAACLAHLIHHT